MPFFILACSFLLWGCYSPRYVYSPSAHNVPFTHAKGETKLSAGYASNLTYKNHEENTDWVNKASGFDVQAAYAIQDSWVVTGAYFNRREKNTGSFSFVDLDSAVIRYRRQLTEFGVGYNKPLNARKTLYIQALAGMGLGRFQFTDDGTGSNGEAYTRHHNAHVTKFYIQPVLTVKRKEYFIASFSNRFSAIKYADVQTDYSEDELIRYQLNDLSQSMVYFWEPAIVNAVGLKKVPGLWLEFQFGLSMLLNKRFVDARSFNFSLGLIADATKWNAKQRQKKEEKQNQEELVKW